MKYVFKNFSILLCFNIILFYHITVPSIKKVNYKKFTIINNYAYYLNENGSVEIGPIIKDDNKYLFNNLKNNKLQFAVSANGQIYYVDNSGVMQTGFIKIDNETYYFDETGTMQKGIVNINNKQYLLDFNTRKLRYGFVETNDGIYYTNDEGIIQVGFINIDNNTYFFNDIGLMQTGWQIIDNKQYYFTDMGIMAKGKIKIDGNNYYFDNNGVFKYVRYLPNYYSQKSYYYIDQKYGNETMGTSGCGPTSLAMIFSSLLNNYISPIDIASYLYYYTNEFNKYNLGMSGLGIIYAANYYGINYHGISSLDELNQELNNGKLVIGLVGGGHFVKPGYTHAIVIFKDDNDVVVYNPNPTYAGSVIYTNTWTIWNEQSIDPYDTNSGYVFYSFN